MNRRSRAASPAAARAGGRRAGTWRGVAGLLLALAGSLGRAETPPAAATAGAPANDLAERVVIVANAREAESRALAEFYAAQRGVPLANIVALPMPEAETITWRQFVDEVYQPLQDELVRRAWISGVASDLRDRLGRRRYAMYGHRISYLVACRGVPLRIANDDALVDPKLAAPNPIRKVESAVDAELSLLAQSGYEITAMVGNPLFMKAEPVSTDLEAVVKVTRLDGPTFESARHLVVSALEGERRGLVGRYYVDLHGPYAEGDQWLRATRDELDQLGFDGDTEDTRKTFDRADRFDAPVFYFGWYRDDLGGPMAAPGFQFAPGAIAMHLHSFSARTLHSETAAWCGPLVARGVAATVGNVFEPYLGFVHRCDLLVRALGHGWNFGDSAYFALPSLSWQEVAIGDPLYRPFPVPVVPAEDASGQFSPYLALRRAHLLERAHRAGDALELLRASMEHHPGLVLGLGYARVAIAAKAPTPALRALAVLPELRQVAAGDWPLAREAARTLAANGQGRAALKVFTALAKADAPTPSAREALLAEAIEVARAVGDDSAVAEFSELHRPESP